MAYIFEVSPHDLVDRLFVPLYRAKHVIAQLEAVGKVPVKDLSSCATIASGTYVRGYRPDGVLYLRVDNIREFICNLNREDIERVSPTAFGITDRVATQPGDILIARTGTLGKAAIALGPVSGAIMSQHLTRITSTNPDCLRPGYLAAFLNCDLGKYQLVYSGYGSTRPELTHTALRSVRLALPHPEIQQTIHDMVLSGTDEMYESTAAFHQAVDRLERILGFSSHALPHHRSFAVDPRNIADTWAPRFHKPAYVALLHWLQREYDCKQLRTLATIQRGKGTRVSHYATKGIPFVRTTSLINYGIDPFPDHYASDDVHELFQQPVQPGDILYSIEGKPGQVAYLTDQDACVFKNHIELVRPNDPDQSMYLFLVLSSRIGKYQADKNTVVQATIPGMAKRLRNFVIPLAPKDPARRRPFQAATAAVVDQALAAASKRASAVRKLRAAADFLESTLERMAPTH
jgi:hypothetical protein